MKKHIIFLESSAREQAKEEMLREELIFFPDEEDSRLRLCDYVKNNCSQPDFNYQCTDYDEDVIIAANPNIGPRQLGVYAAKSFRAGEIVGEIKGTDLFGIRPNAEIERIVDEYQEDTSYVWKLNLDAKDKYAVVIDLLKSGSSTRWVNHAKKPNLEVKVICKQRKDEYGTVLFDYHAYYVAVKNIAFADELTISYGDDYFSVERPQVVCQPQTLVEILHDLAKAQAVDESKISNRNEIKKFFTLLREAMLSKNEQKKQIYLDKNLDPKIYDLSNVEEVMRFQKEQKIELKRNSPYHLFIAPTVRGTGEYRYSLFSGQKIPAKKTLCTLVGQKMEGVPEKNNAMLLWAGQHNIDTNYLVQSGEGGYLYTKDKASEAYCIEGAKHRSEMNVRFDFATNSYITTRHIQPGEEILAYYEDYDYRASPTTLAKVFTDFNESQYYYQATWSNDKVVMDYVIPKTPGYNLDEVDESIYPEFSEQEDTKEWSSVADYDENERILTPGHDLEDHEGITTTGYSFDAVGSDFSRGSEEELPMDKESSHEKRKTWSPSFQFSENIAHKKRKTTEMERNEPKKGETLFETDVRLQ
ncbi:SET domain-containing protein-lysine N-methyltransferase [Fluoribacter gormanii]|uniref:SET domain-containing protein-lysine N-methyltransferase n=1 Tax=Fluoribacter gormanii TaxID=464 RepID=UPI002243E29A|nr:SET domain-containing protein-lysine N-methyltransferase [Fluoribacter gormanii]MCW8470512.1 SET domain-containing protein-lysine N-methyltransferase [Fluoribacter gormanii]